MSATEPLCNLVGIDPAKLSKEESLILEMELFTRLCDELKNFLKVQHKDYFHIMKFTAKKEDEMIEAIFVRYIINDIVSTKTYSLPGIACHTHLPEEVLYEVATGKNTNPSASLLRKIIEIHRSVRPDFYREIMKKLIQDHVNLN